MTHLSLYKIYPKFESHFKHVFFALQLIHGLTQLSQKVPFMKNPAGHSDKHVF